MRTMLYHKEFPLGKVFDTETNKPDPYIDTAPFGSVDSPAKIHMTQDSLIEHVVKAELAKQNKERPELEREFQKKTGAKDVHFAAKEETLVAALDDPKVKPKKKAA